MVKKAAKLVCDGGRFPFEPAMGEADDAIARNLHGGITRPVTLEGGAMTVVGEAISLDHEPMARPIGVNLMSQNFDVGRRRWQIVRAAESKNLILKRRTSCLHISSRIDQTTNHTKGPPAVTARAYSFKLLQVQQS